MPPGNSALSFEEVIAFIKRQANPEAVAGMARYGINPKGTYGVSMPALRAQARLIGKNHPMAEQLWASGIHEARILAALVDDPHQTTSEQMDQWVMEIDSWDVCDQCCGNLFDKTPFAYEKAIAWSERPEEFVRRAGFVMMAALAVHDRTASNAPFVSFLKVIHEGSEDERNFVKKAVNWALRQIGKRNLYLNQKAVAIAWRLAGRPSGSARWIGNDALRELTSAMVQTRLNRRETSRKVSRSRPARGE